MDYKDISLIGRVSTREFLKFHPSIHVNDTEWIYDLLTKPEKDKPFWKDLDGDTQNMIFSTLKNVIWSQYTFAPSLMKWGEEYGQIDNYTTITIDIFYVRNLEEQETRDLPFVYLFDSQKKELNKPHILRINLEKPKCEIKRKIGMSREAEKRNWKLAYDGIKKNSKFAQDDLYKYFDCDIEHRYDNLPDYIYEFLKRGFNDLESASIEIKRPLRIKMDPFTFSDQFLNKIYFGNNSRLMYKRDDPDPHIPILTSPLNLKVEEKKQQEKLQQAELREHHKARPGLGTMDIYAYKNKVTKKKKRSR